MKIEDLKEGDLLEVWEDFYAGYRLNRKSFERYFSHISPYGKVRCYTEGLRGGLTTDWSNFKFIHRDGKNEHQLIKEKEREEMKDAENRPERECKQVERCRYYVHVPGCEPVESFEDYNDALKQAEHLSEVKQSGTEIRILKEIAVYKVKKILEVVR